MPNQVAERGIYILHPRLFVNSTKDPNMMSVKSRIRLSYRTIKNDAKWYHLARHDALSVTSCVVLVELDTTS